MAEFAALSLMGKVVVGGLVAGSAIGAYGAISQGQAAKAQSKSEQDILNYNAAQKIKEAEEMQIAASEEASKFAKDARRFKGTQRVAIAREGVLASEGTPALLLEETAQELEADRIAILKQGFLRSEFAESEAFGLRFQGKSAIARGKNLQTGSYLQAGGTLLTGLGSAGLAYKQMKDTA